MEQQGSAVSKNRDFACACGKKYFSYAALFTHIKQKHDGKAPGPIVRPRSERKRGRPRKTPMPGSSNKNSQSEDGNISNQFSAENQEIREVDQPQIKTKKAAQMLLGSGGFKVFQAYRGENSSNDDLKKTSLKKVPSQLQSSKKKQAKDDKKQLPVASKRFIPKQQKNVSNTPQQKNLQNQFIQLHDRKIIELFLNPQNQLPNANLLNQALKKQCHFLTKIQEEDLPEQTTILQIKNYLLFISKYLTQDQYEVINYVLHMFLQFLYRVVLQKNEKKFMLLKGDQANKTIFQFVQFFEEKNLGVFQSTSSHLNQQNESSGIKRLITCDFVTNVLLYFCYWTRLQSLAKESSPSKPKDEESEPQKKFQKSESESQNMESNKIAKDFRNLVRVQKSKQKKPRIINTIEDILAENISYSLQNQSLKQNDQSEYKESGENQIEIEEPSQKYAA